MIDFTEGNGSLRAAGDSPVWSIPPEEVLRRLGSTSQGLAGASASEKLSRFGPNALSTQREPSQWRLLAKQFLSPIVLILIAATVLSGVLGDYTDATIILVIILLSGLLGFWQERGASRAMRALLAVVAVRARVLRDGAETDVPVIEIVPGDVVMLSAGDLVPGDCIVLASKGLTVDESALTGETFPLDKVAGISPADAPVNQRRTMLFLGTHVSSGSGTVLITDTGQSTEMGAVSERLRTTTPTTGFERGLTSFGFMLARIMIVLVVLIFVANLLLHRPILDSALFSLALAVGLTPQLLPAIVAISLAQGAQMMAKSKVIVRRLDAIEDFGSMSVLCSDKTGTMTEGHVVLHEATDLTGNLSTEVLMLACANASLQLGLRNPIDDAIIAGSPPLPSTTTKLDEVPYDFDRKRLSVLLDTGMDGPVLVTKGALDCVLNVCTTVRLSDGSSAPLAENEGTLREHFAALSAAGYRVLGVSTRRFDGEKVGVADESAMELVGLLTFADPVKADARATIAALVDAGVSVRMITGDNRLVAAHVADQVGLDTTTVLTGADINRETDETLPDLVSRVSVFSELTPVQKERLVKAYRANGAVVGYLGDGINDAPALHAADVGISVESAVSVAKASAAIVLLEKDLSALLAGIQQGRRTFANTMKYIFMTTSANFGNMISMAIASVVLPFLPLLAGQILLINLLTDLPATTIATDSVDPGQLKRAQKWNIRLIRNYMIVFGLLSSVFDLTTFMVLRWGFHSEAAEFRSAWFLGSVLTEVGVLFVLRTRGPIYRSRPSKWVIVSSAAVAIVTVLIPYSPIASALKLVPIPLTLFGIILLITLGYLAATELTKRFFWHRRNPS